MNDDLLTPREAAGILGVRVTTLGRWARIGALKPAIRTPGGHRRYGQADVEAFRAASERAAGNRDSTSGAREGGRR